MDNEFNAKFQILSFPRSGSNFLQSYILQKTDVLCNSIHDSHLANNLPILTVLRKPEDSFRSALSMHRFYKDKEPNIDSLCKSYILMHNYSMENKAIFINFDDLIKTPEKVIWHISKKFNLFINNKEYKNQLIDKKHLNHLSSSANVDGYNEITFLEKDIKHCNELYKDLLLKCIKV
jgi:hypothetical protein